MRTRTTTGALVGLALAGLVLGACKSDRPVATAQTEPPRTEDSVVPSIVYVAISEPSTTPPPDVNPDLVAKCVEGIQLQAFVGDTAAIAVWDLAGRDVAALTAWCEELGRSDTDRLYDVVRRLADVQRWLAAAAAAEE